MGGDYDYAWNVYPGFKMMFSGEEMQNESIAAYGEIGIIKKLQWSVVEHAFINLNYKDMIMNIFANLTP